MYYYPDLPKGFQLSQAHLPLARNGWLDIVGEDGQPKRLRIHKIHMEEDVAKLVHEIEGRTPISLVDFNRAGVPLVEIVTEPDMRSPHDAMEFIRALRTQIRYIGTSECSMEAGTMRVDANISLRPKGTDQLNTKVEVKNMNSIRHLGDAIAYEINRQTRKPPVGRGDRSAYPPLGSGKTGHCADARQVRRALRPRSIGTADSHHRGMEKRNAGKASGNAGQQGGSLQQAIRTDPGGSPHDERGEGFIGIL